MQGIGLFQKYLTVWVLLCMAAGVLVGKYLPGVPAFLNLVRIANRTKNWFPQAMAKKAK